MHSLSSLCPSLKSLPPKTIRFLGFTLLITFFLILLFQMESKVAETKNVYSVWGIPSLEVTERLKKVMVNLRSEFGGPEFEPHVTVVGAIELTEEDAVKRFHSACDGVKKGYVATVKGVATGSFFYQCVYLLLHPSKEVVEASAFSSKQFGFKSSTPYMPHASLLYGDLTEEEKQKAKAKAEAFDTTISNFSFPITRLALYKTDTEDKTLKSWEKIADCELV